MNTLKCKNDGRRAQIRSKKGWNGLDYVEVSECQFVLTVYFVGKAPQQLEAENFVIEGGRRITGIRVTHIRIYRAENDDADDYVELVLDKYGDFSRYRLHIVEFDGDTKQPLSSDQSGRKTWVPLTGFDPRYSSLEFSFKASCPSDLDCKTSPSCALVQDALEINYLAKDYASFRQLILDRLALTMPEWRERHIPDVGITLVELLAYVGDHLSYYQDAVATEAYLDTARRRVSVRRHVRLVDYHLHEGCNARTWVVFEVGSSLVELVPKDFFLITRPSDANYSAVLSAHDLPENLPKPYVIFEALVSDPEQKINLYAAHNAITIYTWDDDQCCLPAGATAATLLDPGTASLPPPSEPDSCDIDTDDQDSPAQEQRRPRKDRPKDEQEMLELPIPAQKSDYQLHLNEDDILIFEEVKGPLTGNPADKDPRHRHAVRLTRADKAQDPLTGKLIWEIEWAAQDALPFALCVSSIKRDDCTPLSNVSLVRGNVVLVDHGYSLDPEDLEPVPEIELPSPCGEGCTPHEPLRMAGRFRPQLKQTDLTFSQPLRQFKMKHGKGHKAASSMLLQEVRKALPGISLTSGGNEWEPRLDLLGSDADDPHFVVEIEDDRSATLRFGDNRCGRAPSAGIVFSAEYRVGNGTAGNVGAESISHIVFRKTPPPDLQVLNIRNPLPAVGGTNPEPVAEAKLFAPHAFKKTLKRAITPQDYADIVLRDFGSRVQRAAARLNWTGSWYEILVAVDLLGTNQPDPLLLEEIKHHLRRYRRIGHHLRIEQAIYVPLEIELQIQVLPHYLRAQVKSALFAAFSNRILTGGHKGFFHPDNLSFGEGIHLSKLVALAQAIPGVENAVVTRLKRQFEAEEEEIEKGLLPLGLFEIARLDQDPNFPEHGNLKFDIRGGR